MILSSQDQLTWSNSAWQTNLLIALSKILLTLRKRKTRWAMSWEEIMARHGCTVSTSRMPLNSLWRLLFQLTEIHNYNLIEILLMSCNSIVLVITLMMRNKKFTSGLTHLWRLLSSCTSSITRSIPYLGICWVKFINKLCFRIRDWWTILLF